LRDTDRPLSQSALVTAAPAASLRDPAQRERCLDTLVADGLVEPLEGGRFRLPASPGRRPRTTHTHQTAT
jgi:A/G-specific adenine glycosylase